MVVHERRADGVHETGEHADGTVTSSAAPGLQVPVADVLPARYS